jgi:5,5'-dehydrodivanillate O-demethylase
MTIAADETTQPYREADYIDLEHTGPGTLAGRFMRRFWHPVYTSEELKPGWSVPIMIMCEPLTLYRGESGDAHLVDFRCAHRATQLSTGWVEDDCIRCRYHGWKYDGSGQCVEAPLENPNFHRRIRIKSYPVQEYLGLIFAYMGEGTPPPLPHYHWFDQEGVLETKATPRDCNYFNELENDPEHVGFTHRDPKLPRGEFNTGLKARFEESSWGIAQYRTYPTGYWVVHHGMPNIHSTSSRGPELRFKVPIDDEHHVSFMVALKLLTGEAAAQRREHHAAAERLAVAQIPVHDELLAAIFAGKVRLHDVDADPPPGISMINVQDEVTQIGQGKIRDRRQEHLGQSDAYVVLLRSIWERELRALAEGRPLKDWHFTEDLQDTPRPFARDGEELWARDQVVAAAPEQA